MRRSVRILTGLLCLLFAAVLLSCSVLAAVHPQHECTVKNCCVCALLSSWAQVLRGMAAVLMIWYALRLAARAFFAVHSARLKNASAITPVTLKVKLSS